MNISPERLMMIFLGGTVGNNNWRKAFIEQAIALGIPKEFLINPVVSEWNEEVGRVEDEAKRLATHFIFYLGNPRQEGNELSNYSIIEAQTHLQEDLDRTVIIFDLEDRTLSQHAAHTLNILRNTWLDDFPSAKIFDNTQDALFWLAREAVQPINHDELAILDGTVGNNPWRTKFLEKAQAAGLDTSKFFNPVVPIWSPELAKREEAIRQHATLHIFYLGSPMQEGRQLSGMALAQAHRQLYREEDNVVIIYNYDGIEGHQLKTFKKMIRDMQGRWPSANIFEDMDAAINWLKHRMVTRKQADQHTTREMKRVTSVFQAFHETD